MQLEREFLELFAEFLQTRRGVSLKLWDDPANRGEIGRFFLSGRFCVIRDFEQPCDVLEVFCSDGDFIRQLEQDWFLYFVSVQSLANEDEDVQESNN